MTTKKTGALPERIREGRQREYNPEPLVARIKALMGKLDSTPRKVSLGAGLDPQALMRIFRGQRPGMPTCILLADYFGVNPNEFLGLAGWPTLDVFDIRTASAENLPPEAVDVALDIAKIPDPGTRKKVAQAIRTLLAQYFSDA